MALRLNGQTSGYVELDVPAAAGSHTLTLPNSGGSSGQYLQTNGSGTLSWAAGTEYQGPTFRASRSGTNQTLSSGVWTKLQFDTEDFDTDNNYDNSTNYRFTPSKAGYYFCFVNAFLNVTTSGATTQQVGIYKNGSRDLYGRHTVGGFYGVLSTSGIIYLNGSTDYIEAYGEQNGSTPLFTADSTFGATWVHD